ncbi:MAG: FAD-dependent monooxygenase, partial [Betaproteobacteria bacterium]
MPATYTPPTYPYRAPPELSGELRVPVAIVGAGPVGLACALEMALAGVRAVVLDDNDTVSTGSRAICYAKRTLEILDRYGCGEPVVERGIGWRVGKVFHGERLAYQFDLLPESGHRRPAFVNLQQYHLEETMLARLLALGGEVRWKNRVAAVEQDGQGAALSVETPDGD